MQLANYKSWIHSLRYYHAFMEILVKIESTNRYDIHAVAIYRDTEIVGHVPYLAPRMSAFFMRENKAFAEITRPKVNTVSLGGLTVLYHPFT